MGFFGLGRSSSSTSTAAKPAPAAAPAKTGPDKADLAATAVRGSDASAKAAALERLLADPQANAAQLEIVAVQDADGPSGLRGDDGPHLRQSGRRRRQARPDQDGPGHALDLRPHG
ncbi:MAG: hypothetical protein J0M02_16180, partial [Planctomycetes bacterium]|nr:hypothetical protein [Planctomycetota bacterium]